ncbi:MAG TPA: hypothetical protein PKY59_07070 [Pyrinomonadaceae bacterium]|nr:hypothetical protein [Pyrinomonadaceae bacterium]
MTTHNIELIEGYTDKDGNIHKEVEIGKRLTVADVMLIERDPQAQNPVLYEDLIRRMMITRFGKLKMPLMLPVLLKLDTIDRDDLGFAINQFLQNTRPNDNGELLPDNSVRLMFGLTIESTTYNVFKFGNRLTGQDQADAHAQKLDGISKAAFELGKQICEISDFETGLTVKGSLTLEQISKLDGEDFSLLRVAGELYRQSFRYGRKRVSEQRDGADGTSADDKNVDDGKGNSESADRTV